MKKSAVINKIKEYHIIKKILNDAGIKKLPVDSKVAHFIAAFTAHVKYFGSIKIGANETFDELFARLEESYLSSDASHKKIDPEQAGYEHYIEDVLGATVLDSVGATLEQPENKEKMRAFTLEVGRKQTTTALVVANSVRDYAALAIVMEELARVSGSDASKQIQLERIAGLLDMSEKKNVTMEQIRAVAGHMEARIIAKIVAAAPKSDEDFIKGIAILTGRKVNEIKTLVQSQHGEVLNAIGEIKTPITGMVVDLGTVKTDVAHIKGKVDAMASDIDEIKKNTAGLGKKKTAIAVTAGAAGMAALLVGGHFLGSAIYNAVTPDKLTEAELLTDYMSLVNMINGLQVDGISDAEKQNFVDVDLNAFVEKYKGTNLEAKSLECRDALLANINGTMEIGGQVGLITGYFQDTAALDATLNTLIQSNGALDANERDGFISGDVAAFTAKYAGTALETASKTDAAGFTAYANAAYELGASNYDAIKALADGYSIDVKSLIVELDRLTDDADGLTQADKDAFVGSASDPNAVSVYNFTQKYAGTAFESASQGQGTELSALAETLRILTQSGVDLSNVNADLIAYGNDVAKLNVDLSNLINDADGLTQTESDNFFANDVAAFTAKYAGTALEGASKNQETGLTSIATAALGHAQLSADNALLSEYHLDVQNLNTTLSGLISNDGVLDATELAAFIGSASDPNAISVYNFVEEYKGTSLEAASAAQAGGFTTIANSTYELGQTQQLMADYNSDLAGLDSALYGYLADASYEAAEKTEFEGLVQDFLDKYASTTLKARSEIDADVMKTLSTRISEMSELKQQAIGELATEKGKVTDLNNQIVALRSENNTLAATNKDYADRITALEAQVEELSGKIDELMNKIANAPTDAQVQALLAQIGELEGKITDLNSQVSSLEGQVSTLTTENAELKAKNEELTTEVSNLKTENAGLKADLDAANTTIDSLNQVVDILKTEKASLEEQLKNKDITIAEYEARIAELEAIETELRAQIQDLTEQIAEIAEELEEKKDAYNKLVEELEAAKARIAELEAEKKALEEDLKNNYISKADYDAKVAELNAEIEANKALIAENAELQRQLAEARAQIVALEEQLAGSSVEATNLVFDIYEYITGTKTNDIATAMKVISEQLGITTVPPSQDAESNVKQPS